MRRRNENEFCRLENRCLPETTTHSFLTIILFSLHFELWYPSSPTPPLMLKQVAVYPWKPSAIFHQSCQRFFVFKRGLKLIGFEKSRSMALHKYVIPP